MDVLSCLVLMPGNISVQASSRPIFTHTATDVDSGSAQFPGMS